MKYKIVGGYNRSGVSKKTNELYNMTILFGMRPCVYSPSAVGLECKEIVLQGDVYPVGLFEIGSVYNVDYDDRGRVADIEQMDTLLIDPRTGEAI